MSRINDVETHMAAVAQWMSTVAKRGIFLGNLHDYFQRSYFESCRQVDHTTSTVLIFTRDGGHHSSGWMKNPDYERCLHLSMSPAPSPIILPDTVVRAELDKATVTRWIKAFFGDHCRYVWAESPKSDLGRQANVWHWRLFCDENWQPILPRGEVYSTELTELGWKSASELLELGGPVVESTVDPS